MGMGRGFAEEVSRDATQATRWPAAQGAAVVLLEAFGEILSESKYRGLTSKDLLTNKPYKAMLERDKTKKKLSEELRGRLVRGE